MVEKHDIMFENLHGLSPMGPIRGPENCDSKPNFLSKFFFSYNIIKVVVIIMQTAEKH